MQTKTYSLAELETLDPGSPKRGAERRFLCPDCGADKPRDSKHRSLAVNTSSGVFFCHRCEVKGCLMEYWQDPPKIQKKQNSRQRIREQFAVPPRSESIQSDSETTTFDISSKMGKFQRYFVNSPAEEYLKRRGISAEIAIQAGCGYAEKWDHWEKDAADWELIGSDRRVVFPVFDPGVEIVAIQGAAIDDDFYKSKKITRGEKSKGIFQTAANIFLQPLIAICEAPIDAMSLAMCGIPSIALLGTSFPEWLPLKLCFKKILLATDADEAGDKLAAKLSPLLSSRGSKTLRLRTETAKDWSEHLEAAGLPQMENELRAFSAELPDEERFSDAVNLTKDGKLESAEFVAALISDVSLRSEFLYEFIIRRAKAA